MARDFIIQYQHHISRLSEDKARDFLQLLERNGIVTPHRQQEILHSGQFNFNTVVDHFSHNPSHQFSFLEFAQSPLGRNFRDFSSFVRYTQDFGANIFQNFWSLALENQNNPSLFNNPTLIYFRGPRNSSSVQRLNTNPEPHFWTSMIDEWGLAVYFEADPAVQEDPEIARYALRMAPDEKNLASALKLLAQGTNLTHLSSDESFFQYAVIANPAIVQMLAPQLLENEAFILSLCRKNFNVLSYLPQIIRNRTWPILVQSYHLDPARYRSYEDFNYSLRQWMTDTRRLHRLDAAFELLRTHEVTFQTGIDTRPTIFLMYPDPSADQIGYFRIREDLDSLIQSHSQQHRFLYLEVSTASEVFVKLDFFTNLIGQRGQLIWSAHGDENGLQLSFDPQRNETEYFRASDFEGQNIRQYIRQGVFLAACSSGEYLSRRFSALNTGLSFTGPDRLIGGSLYFLQHTKLFPINYGYEQFISFKS